MAEYDSINVDSLSDIRLQEYLKSYGCCVGPITSSTRSVYVRKLQDIIERSGNSTSNGPFTVPIQPSHSKGSKSNGMNGAKSRSKKTRRVRTSSETSTQSVGSPQENSYLTESRQKVSKLGLPVLKIPPTNHTSPIVLSNGYNCNCHSKEQNLDPVNDSLFNSKPEVSVSESVCDSPSFVILSHRSSSGSSAGSQHSYHSNSPDQSFDIPNNFGANYNPKTAYNRKLVNNTNGHHASGSPPGIANTYSTPDCSVYYSSAGEQRSLARDLINTLNDPDFIGSDVCFQTKNSKRIFASRAVLAARCPAMIPYLYSTEAAIPLKVMTLTSQMCVVWARPSDLVANVKYRIFFQQGIHMKTQRLIYKQNELLDHLPLSHYAICVATTIHLVLSSDQAPSIELLSLNGKVREQPLQEEIVEQSTPSLFSQSSIPIGMTSPLTSFRKQLISDAINSECAEHSHSNNSSVNSIAINSAFDGNKPLPFHVEHVVYLPGVDHTCANIFLRYLYSGEIQLNLNQIAQVTALAHTFSVIDLKKRCLEYLQSNINDKYLTSVLREAERFKTDSVKDICYQFAKQRGLIQEMPIPPTATLSSPTLEITQDIKNLNLIQ